MVLEVIKKRKSVRGYLEKEIPDNVTIVCLMTLGNPAGDEFKSGRKPLGDIICYNDYKELVHSGKFSLNELSVLS